MWAYSRAGRTSALLTEVVSESGADPQVPSQKSEFFCFTGDVVDMTVPA